MRISIPGLAAQDLLAQLRRRHAHRDRVVAERHQLEGRHEARAFLLDEVQYPACGRAPAFRRTPGRRVTASASSGVSPSDSSSVGVAARRGEQFRERRARNQRPPRRPRCRSAPRSLPGAGCGAVSAEVPACRPCTAGDGRSALLPTDALFRPVPSVPPLLPARSGPVSRSASPDCAVPPCAAGFAAPPGIVCPAAASLPGRCPERKLTAACGPAVCIVAPRTENPDTCGMPADAVGLASGRAVPCPVCPAPG